MKTGQPDPVELEQQLQSCMVRDRTRLRRRLRRLGPDTGGSEWQAFQRAVDAARQRHEQRLAGLPQPTFPAELPISRKAETIIQAIAEYQVIIVCGETGSGKTTQLPKLCLATGRGVDGLIGHTQPRRLAARTLAARVASELNSPPGSVVGYKIRHTDQTGQDSYIKLMTDGILLAELRSDRDLLAYDTLIIDEAHERSLNIDFILGYLKRLLSRRPDLKVIITSATIDVQRFADFFDGAPIIEVSGRTYPVEVNYRPLDDDDDLAFEHGILNAIRELSGRDRGDILVFLEGEREINELAKFLRKQQLPDTEILPLYARLGAAGQGRIFESHQRRHIVLATNIAETSLTIPGIRYVIDSGYARISRYSPRSKVQRLPIEKIAQASAEQRKGRCGRQSDGICIRLYSEEDYAQRPEFTEPEILRTNLAAVVLHMKALRLGAIDDFPFLEPPDRRQISDAQRLLTELGAIDHHGGLTPVGRQLAQLPLDPSFGRMLLAAAELDCLDEALVIVSALSIQDPRERPLEAQEKADAAHARFRDEQSDFIEYLKLWEFLDAQTAKLSKNRFRHLCRQGFLSYTRIREWRDIHRQLASQMRDMGYRRNRAATDYETLHTALSYGLLGHVAQKTGAGEYTGARGIRLRIFPGSSQFNSQPKWIMAAELLETSQLFARTVARIDPEWLLKPAAALIKSEYFDPAWDREQQRVNAFERITLYGLPLIARRPVNYARVQPDDARRLFIQHALAEGELKGRAAFLRHNRELIESIRREERKIRRPDILDEHAVFDFYHRIVPDDVCDGPSFEVWRKQAERETPKLLFLKREQIIRHEPETANTYPEQLEVNGIRLPIDYRFQPGSEADGITVSVPLQLLNQLDADAFERLVPGLLEEKVTAMLRALPKNLRRHFVPVPDTARRCLQELQSADGPLSQALSACLLRLTGVDVAQAHWRSIELPQHLKPRFRIIDADGHTLACDRDYQALRDRLANQVAESFSDRAGEVLQREGITAWDFDELPEVIEIEQQGYTVRAYPALVDCDDSVAIRCVDTPEKARVSTHAGLRRLFMLGLRKDLRYLARNLPHRDTLCLAYSKLGRCEDLAEDILKQVTESACMSGSEAIRTADAFDSALQRGRPQLVSLANELCELLLDILERHGRLRAQLSGSLPPQWLAVAADIRQQLENLVYAGFVLEIPLEQLRHYPRYLDAIHRRLERLQHNPIKDRQLAARVEPWWKDYLDLARVYAGHENKPAALLQYRWLLEEYRVSLFAQDLKTAEPVSDKRLQALRDELRRAA